DVEQRLGGVLVRAVTGVHDRGVEETGDEIGRARGAVADDDDVGVEGLEVADGVAQGFALLERGGLGGEVDDVGRKALGGELETDAGPGGGLNEEVHDGLAAQGGNLFDGALADGLEGAGGVEHGADLLRGEGFDVEQMLALPAHAVLVFSRWTESSA